MSAELSPLIISVSYYAPAPNGMEGINDFRRVSHAASALRLVCNNSKKYATENVQICRM
jgi:hypothetical protein